MGKVLIFDTVPFIKIKSQNKTFLALLTIHNVHRKVESSAKNSLIGENAADQFLPWLCLLIPCAALAP